MKIIKNVLLFFVLDWVIILILFAMEFLAKILDLVGHILPSQINDVVTPLVLIPSLVVLISYFISKRFLKTSTKEFLIAQIIFTISYIVTLTIALGAITKGILMNA